MFQVKHDLGHDPAVAASNGLEYAPAGAHDIRWARPEEHSEPGVDLATGRPVLATAGARRARGAVRAARHLATVQTMPAAVQLYPKAWARRSPTTPRRVLATSGPNEGVWGRFRAGCCGARRRPGMNVTPSGLGRGNIDCGVSRGRICRRCPTRASCPVSRKTAGGRARQHGHGYQSYDSSRRSGCSNPGWDGRMHFSERSPQRRPWGGLIGSPDSVGPVMAVGSVCRWGASLGELAECLWSKGQRRARAEDPRRQWA